MQSKNNIKILLLFAFSLVLVEPVFGWGIFWSVILVLGGVSWIYWLAFFSGIFLSVYYGQVLGLMSLYMILAVFVWNKALGFYGFKPLSLAVYSLSMNIVFNFLFGLKMSILEFVLIVIVGYLLGSRSRTTQVIKVNI